MRELIKYYVYMIVWMAIFILITGKQKRRIKAVQKEESDDVYVVKYISTFEMVYFWNYLTVVGLLLLFTWAKLNVQPDIQRELFSFTVWYALIAILVMLFANRWSIIVRGEELEIYRFFHRRLKVRVSDIEFKFGKKDQVILYKEGKKILTINLCSDNRARLEELLENESTKIN